MFELFTQKFVALRTSGSHRAVLEPQYHPLERRAPESKNQLDFSVSLLKIDVNPGASEAGAYDATNSPANSCLDSLFGEMIAEQPVLGVHIEKF